MKKMLKLLKLKKQMESPLVFFTSTIIPVPVKVPGPGALVSAPL